MTNGPKVGAIIVIVIAALAVAFFAISKKEEVTEVDEADTTTITPNDESDFIEESTETDIVEDEKILFDNMPNIDENGNRYFLDSMDMYEYSGTLADVSGGTATGTAQAVYFSHGGIYHLKVTFENLPDPQGTDFYEGWIVEKAADGSIVDVLSTGKTTVVDGEEANIFNSDQDLTDHAFYVLTIEPDDGDPAPAEHILEGTMTN